MSLRKRTLGHADSVDLLTENLAGMRRPHSVPDLQLPNLRSSGSRRPLHRTARLAPSGSSLLLRAFASPRANGSGEGLALHAVAPLSDAFRELVGGLLHIH